MHTARPRTVRLGKAGPRVLPLIAALADAIRKAWLARRDGSPTPSAHLARDIGLETLANSERPVLRYDL